MGRRLPWALVPPLAFAGSWLAHVVGRSLTVGPREGSEAAEHLERTTAAHAGSATLGLAGVLAPFVAIAVVLLAAGSWSRARGRSARGAGPGWFLILPALAYVAGELLERLISGGSETLTLHALHEPGLLVALALQVPFGAAAYAVARLLLAAGRAIIAKVRRSVREKPRPQRSDVGPLNRIAPARWSCLVGARGLRGPPAVLPS